MKLTEDKLLEMIRNRKKSLSRKINSYNTDKYMVNQAHPRTEVVSEWWFLEELELSITGETKGKKFSRLLKMKELQAIE